MNESVIAKKYAKAFFNVFAPSLSDEDFITICQLGDFFEHNKNLLYFLSWHSIAQTEKVAALLHAFEYFNLKGKPYKALITLLSKHKRTFLIKDVLIQLCILYEESRNIGSFAITSSHKMSPEEMQYIEEYLANHSGQDIMYTYSVDKNLIAGVRAQSDTLLFEYSIRKRLAQIKLPKTR